MKLTLKEMKELKELLKLQLEASYKHTLAKIDATKDMGELATISSKLSTLLEA